MDGINELSDDLIVKILSFLPTKVAISTSILCKRWKFLWLSLPNLHYSGRDDSLLPLRDFISNSLPLHRAPVLDTLRLDLCELSCDPVIKPHHLKLWLQIALSLHLRHLHLSHYSLVSSNETIFPTCFFACNSLVTLKLRYVSLANVPSLVSLPSLKSLLLDSVTFHDDDGEIFQELLSICPLLEDLDVRLSEYDNMQKFALVVPSLRKLSLSVPQELHLDCYEIDTPSLELLKLKDWSESPSSFNNMPNLKEAYVDVLSFHLKSILGSIASVTDLTICSEDVYGDGFVFDKLEHLTLCQCRDDSSNLLARFLRDSRNLRVLDISVLDLHGDLKTNDMVFWNQPSSVPECLLSSLELLEWVSYFGRPQDRDIAVYILKNARHLKTVTIWANTNEHFVPNLKMIKELTFSSRASSTCELVFNED